MKREDIIRMARQADGHAYTNRHMKEEPAFAFSIDRLERFAALVAAAEREAFEKKVEEFARKWWSAHCASNKHMDTTLKAHNDFCALKSAIRARGQ